MIRVFVVDDHEIVRRGITRLIDADPGLEVVGESATAKGTLGRVAATSPDVVVLDVNLPDGGGVDVCRLIRSSHPDIRCLMLTAFDDDAASVAAVVAGASGYVLKTIHGSALIDSIHRVARGESLVPGEVSERVRRSLEARVEERDGPSAELTLRERQALTLIAEGLTNRQIGERLGLAEKTVKNYVSGLLAKLGMQRRTQAAVYAAREGEGRTLL
ncbi:response regulator transcription factor [uncultured Microbacterium sp.]|uniref:response regulator transcription factor n=1 Tax=uncultured Microbacterium sp. TaxID=191216 RepID=UPI0028D18635|nr:response regulator transcription factor [uncultured Microbacterium sp.]